MATIILKATEKCNSNCIYCDVVRRKPSTTPIMSYEILDVCFSRINTFLMSNPDDNITVLWHGGEPLLLGVDFFKTALDIQEKHCTATLSRINHNIQTNLTLLSKDFLEIFKKMGIGHLGSSYDPIQNVRGPGKNIDSEIYNKMFLSGLKLSRESAFNVGIIYVVTKRSLERPLDIFYYLTNLFINGGINLNQVLIYDSEIKDIAITPNEYADFLGEIFPVWWKYKEIYYEIEPFKSFSINAKRDALSLSCVDSGDCAYNHVNIDPRGETSQCGRSSDWGLLSYGNILDRSLHEILYDSQRGQLISRNEILLEKDCKDCRFWSICHGGCPLDSYDEHGDFVHKTRWCLSKKRFIEKFFEPITGLTF
ncbi:MAG: radical SAM protein [Nitrospirae bacterium]|nr:radical SAM protein [Nitrospirota bacterium]MBF0534495.1 radical SAM protein [Nitrospirota bacterium]MBF0617121.1 radical SAM protein [Nitrospirota bacterium]